MFMVPASIGAAQLFIDESPGRIPLADFASPSQRQAMNAKLVIDQCSGLDLDGGRSHDVKVHHASSNPGSGLTTIVRASVSSVAITSATIGIRNSRPVPRTTQTSLLPVTIRDPSALNDADTTLKDKDASKEALQAKSEALMAASQKLGEAMYAQQQAQGGGGGGPQGGGGAEGKGGGDEKVVDAEYTEVKDRK